MAGADAARSTGSERQDRPAETFEEFFKSNYHAVVGIAHAVLGDIHSAQDVAQDVFIAAERRFGDAENSAHAAAWVRVAAAHSALNAARGQRRRRLRHIRATNPAAPMDPEEIALDRVSQQQVRRALGRLPKRNATVLVLRHSGLSYTEIAELMNVKVGQVGTMLRRAEAALRKEIEDVPPT
ncbi:MAG: sigma-70 family RNA polymerase sigma factor [Acidimicrobiales bacterium]|jgi:RNA polymerase sigma factor (sigma-70 family)